MDILEILKSKNHNPHHLMRYWKFICSRKLRKEGEKHHICPKASDLFPEYEKFSKNKWNKIILTPREHYIAHLLLHKTYGNSQSRAFYLMMNTSKSEKMNSKSYELAKKIFLEWFKVNNPMNNLESRKKCSQPGNKNGMFGKPGVNLGKTGSLNHLFGKKRPSHSQKMTGANNPSFGITPTKIKCQYCDSLIDYRNYNRWHGEKCKIKEKS
jgi:hypothetical protein